MNGLDGMTHAARIAPRLSPWLNRLVPETVDSLILDLLAWIGPEPRPYAEVIDAWRTSCPRLPVWEEATERGLISRRRMPGVGALITVSPAGQEHLRRSSRAGRAPTP